MSVMLVSWMTELTTLVTGTERRLKMTRTVMRSVVEPEEKLIRSASWRNSSTWARFLHQRHQLKPEKHAARAELVAAGGHGPAAGQLDQLKPEKHASPSI